jgi:hypothetical protein
MISLYSVFFRLKAEAMRLPTVIRPPEGGSHAIADRDSSA